MIGFLVAALNLDGARWKRDATSILGAVVAAAVTVFALFVLTLSPAQAGVTSIGGEDCAVPGGPLADRCCFCGIDSNGVGLCFKSEVVGKYDRCEGDPLWCPDEKNCQILMH